jgi:glycosyltransferase involved in cell wall biosynthesis
MTVLYIISGSVMGGATHSVLSLIEAMVQKGHRVIVVSPNMEGTLKQRLEALSVTFYVIPVRFRIYPGQEHPFYKQVPYLIDMLQGNFRATRAIQRVIKTERADLVHTNVGPVTCGYEACSRLGIPHIWHIREYGDQDFGMRMFPSKKSFRKWLSNSYVISITHALIRYNELEHSSTAHVIYNGVRRSSDARYECPKEDYFLCASRISPEKGFDQIFRVFASFLKTHPNYRLMLLGNGDPAYMKQLAGLAASLNLEKAVEFKGYQHNVSDYMAKARALLVASPSEGFGRMTAEAAFAGCLVIGHNTAGTKEIMDIIGGYPYLTDNEMEQAMNCVVHLSESDYYAKAMDAQQKAVLHFSEEQYVEKVLSLYESILLKRQAGS